MKRPHVQIPSLQMGDIKLPILILKDCRPDSLRWNQWLLFKNRKPKKDTQHD